MNFKESSNKELGIPSQVNKLSEIAKTPNDHKGVWNNPNEMTIEEAIKFGEEQLEIFGEDCDMYNFIKLAIEALTIQSTFECDEREEGNCPYYTAGE